MRSLIVGPVAPLSSPANLESALPRAAAPGSPPAYFLHRRFLTADAGEDTHATIAGIATVAHALLHVPALHGHRRSSLVTCH